MILKSRVEQLEKTFPPEVKGEDAKLDAYLVDLAGHVWHGAPCPLPPDVDLRKCGDRWRQMFANLEKIFAPRAPEPD